MSTLPDLAALTPGHVLPGLNFGPITRTTLALYAGASGDHNPAHIDSDFAKAAGLPDVFAHGMLSFGVLARAGFPSDIARQALAMEREEAEARIFALRQ